MQLDSRLCIGQPWNSEICIDQGSISKVFEPIFFICPHRDQVFLQLFNGLISSLISRPGDDLGVLALQEYGESFVCMVLFTSLIRATSNLTLRWGSKQEAFPQRTHNRILKDFFFLLRMLPMNCLWVSYRNSLQWLMNRSPRASLSYRVLGLSGSNLVSRSWMKSSVTEVLEFVPGCISICRCCGTLA